MRQQLRAGTLKAQIAPTEKWLLDPLIRYASTAGLDESAGYFTELITRIEERLSRAIAARENEASFSSQVRDCV